MKKIDIKKIIDARGKITILDEKDLPFQVKRIFWIHFKRGVKRGNHAHKKTRQYMICIRGTCNLEIDYITAKQKIQLIEGEGIIIEPDYWINMVSNDDCILLVLSSEKYEEADYIRDYKEFIKIWGNDGKK